MCLLTKIRPNRNKYLTTAGYELLTVEQKKEICNGMGSKTSWWNRIVRWIIPDHFFGLDMTEPANIHDYMYFRGGNLWDKVVADLVFLYNMLWRIYSAGKQHRLKRYWMAVRYFSAVLVFGGSSFREKEAPDSIKKTAI